jgi:integrase
MFFLNRSERKQGSNIGGVAELLRQLGKYHCALPDEACDRIASWASKVQNDRRSGMTHKNRARLRGLTDERTRAMLLHCPKRFMLEAERLPEGSRAARVLARAAVALEILLICPMRVGNLRTLRFGEHLRRQGSSNKLFTHIHVGEHETKNRAAIEWPIPESTARLVDRYVRRHRDAAEANDHLFPGENGRGVVSVGAMHTTITETVAAELGVEINPHLLRHFAAYLYLRSNPGAYELVRRILCHKTIETTIKFYCGLETEFAAKHFDDTVLRERQRTQATAVASFCRRSPGKGR